jgi:hypothetical protein
MEETNLALLHYGNNFSKFGIIFTVDGTQYHWTPVSDPKQIVQKLELRLPYFTPLFNVIDSYFTKNIPAEFWLHKEPLKKSHDTELAKQLHEALNQLEAQIEQKWKEMLTRTNDTMTPVKVETDPQMLMWLLLIDEWLMGQRLLYTGEDLKSREWKFPRSLTVTPTKDTWQLIVNLFNMKPSHAEPALNSDIVAIDVK